MEDPSTTPTLITHFAKKCLICNSTSIEQKQYDINKNSKSFQQHYIKGLQCINCKRFICHSCIILFTDAIKPNKNLSKYHNDMHQWLRSIQLYTSKHQQIDNFIGHCCLLSTQTIKKRKYSSLSNPHITSRPFTTREDDIKSITCPSLQLGGSFVYEQLQLIIPTSFDHCDCFALGKEKNLPPITHYVLDEIYAHELMSNNSIPKIIERDIPSNWNVWFEDVTVNVPHNFLKQKHVSKYHMLLFTFL